MKRRGRGPAPEDECFKCGRKGHWANECRDYGGGGGRNRSPRRGSDSKRRLVAHFFIYFILTLYF